MVNKAAQKLRAQLAQDDFIAVCPGVYDGLTARTLLEQGFEHLYMTGAGTALSVLGMPDLGMTTIDDMANNAGMIASLNRDVPVIADADIAFGGPVMAARTVEKYIRHGVAALHIEDQVANKRCGHLGGKELVDLETYLGRIRAADKQRKLMDDDIVIISRIDSLQSLGYDDAIHRLKSAVEAGADVCFFEGMTSKEMMRQAVKDLAPTPCLLNMVAGGITPIVTAQEAKEMGFKIQIWCLLGMTATYLACREAGKTLKETGMIEDKFYEDGRVVGGVREIFDCAKMPYYTNFDKECGGKSYLKKW